MPARPPRKTAAETSPLDPVSEAQRTLDAHRQQQLLACQSEIQAVLAKYGMALTVQRPEIELVLVPTD
jgi:hypothetical protein